MEVEPFQVVAAIKEAPTEFGAADQHLHRLAAIAEPRQIRRGRLVAITARPHAGPMRDLRLQHDRRRPPATSVAKVTASTASRSSTRASVAAG